MLSVECGEKEKRKAMAIRSLENLVAWQKARVLTSEIYRLTRQGEFKKDFGLAGQMQRAAVSAMSNIAEGFQGKVIRNSSSFCLFRKAQRLKSRASSMLL